MAITSVETALAQYNDNLDWETSAAKASLARQAVRYLIANQPITMSIAGRTITKNLIQLQSELKAISEFLPITPRTTPGALFVPAWDSCAESAGGCR